MKLMCLRCNITFTGVATVGHWCAYCDFRLVDVDAVLLEAAATYDPLAGWAQRAPIEIELSPERCSRRFPVRFPELGWSFPAGGGL